MRLVRWVVFLCPVWGVFLSGQTRSDRFQIGQEYGFFQNAYGDLGGQHLMGGRFDVRVSRYLWATSQLQAGVTNYPPPGVSSIDGGRTLLGCFGVKSGLRHRRLGVFGEFGGGFLSWSQVLSRLDPIALPIYEAHFGRRTDPLINVGGAFEFYSRHNLGFRLGLADSVVFYQPHRFNDVEPPTLAVIKHNLHVSTGLFYRF